MIHYFNTAISLEHKDITLIDVPVVCKIETYKGCGGSDDPDEIEVLSATCVTDIFMDESDVTLIKRDQDIEIDQTVEEEIINKFNK